jgi:hypothetical protein
MSNGAGLASDYMIRRFKDNKVIMKIRATYSDAMGMCSRMYASSGKTITFYYEEIE